MIIVKGKPLAYAEAVERLAKLKEDLEEAEDTVTGLEEEMDAAEDDVYRIKNEQNLLLDQMKHCCDVKTLLPTALLWRGYKLTEVALVQKNISSLCWNPETGMNDLVRSPPAPTIQYVLEDNRGNVVKTWLGYVTLSDLMEIK